MTDEIADTSAPASEDGVDPTLTSDAPVEIPEAEPTDDDAEPDAGNPPTDSVTEG